MTPSLYTVAIAVDGLLGVAGLALWWWRAERSAQVAARVLAAVTIGITGAAWVVRFVDAGHLPLFGTYESALSLSLAVLLVCAVLDWRARAHTLPLGALVSALLLFHATRFDATVYALTISERSWVVDVHAIVAWVGFGLLTANAALSLRAVLPDAAPSRALSRTLELGFVGHSAMMATGMVYKFLLFGKAWSFDPIELLGMVTWLAYGTLLHMHLFARWNGRKLAAWSLVAFVILVVSYRAIVYFPGWSTYHIFDMNLREHVPG